MDRRTFLTTLCLGGAGALGLPRRARGQEIDPTELLNETKKAADAQIADVIASTIPSGLMIRYSEISGKDGYERDELTVKGPPKYYQGMIGGATAALTALVNAMKKGGWHTAANEVTARRVYSGRGSPDDIRLILRWVDWERANLPKGSRSAPDVASIYRGNRSPSATLAQRNAALQRHFNDHIRVDCNGFAGNFYKSAPHVAPRYLGFPLEETAPLNYLLSLSGKGARAMKTLAELETGDAIVYLGGSHIAVIEQVRPASSHAEALRDYEFVKGYDSLVPKALPTAKATLAKEPDGPCAVVITVESCNDGIYSGMVMRANIVTPAGTAQPDAPPSNQANCYNPDFRSKNKNAIKPDKQTIPCTEWAKHPRRPRVPAFRIHNNIASSEDRGRLVSVVRM